MSEPISPDAEFWYLLDTKEERAEWLGKLAQKAMLENSGIATRAYRFASIFEGFTLTNLSSWGADTESTGVYPGLDIPVIKNHVRKLVYAFMNKSFANDNPRGLFVTRGGDYDQQLKAETLGETLDTEFAEEHGMFRDIDDLWRHGALIAAAATGGVWVFGIKYEDSTRFEAELDDGLTVGVYRDQRFGRIKTLVRTVFMNPEAALSKFGEKHRKEIYRNVEFEHGVFSAGKAGETATHQSRRRVVRVVMGWGIGDGGREMFCLQDGHVLRDRPWERDKPPCVDWQYKRELGGEHGSPLTLEVYTAQMHGDRILNDVVDAESKTPQIIMGVRAGSNASGALKRQLSDVKSVQIVETTDDPGSAWKSVVSPKFSKDSLSLEATLAAATNDNSQIAINHATGAKPVGTTSGVQESLAASYYTEAFADAERRALSARAVGTSRIALWVLQELADDGFERWVGEKKHKRLVKSVDLDLDESRYVIEIKVASQDKDTPAARMEKIDRMLKDPAIQFTGSDWNQAMKTFDVDAVSKQAFALQDWAEKQVKKWLKSSNEQMGEPDFYEPPETWMQLEGLKTVLRVSMLAFLEARGSGVPKERLAWFEKFQEEALTLIHSEEGRLAKLANPAGQPAPEGPPQPMMGQ